MGPGEGIDQQILHLLGVRPDNRCLPVRVIAPRTAGAVAVDDDAEHRLRMRNEVDPAPLHPHDTLTDCIAVVE